MVKLIPIALLVLVIIYLATLSFLTRHDRLKPESKRHLSACPDQPNCVFSQSLTKAHKVDPFLIQQNSHQQSWKKLIATIKQSDGEVLINDGRYCHAVFTSSIFRFKDDLEIVLSKDKIDVRSASRAGKSDLGQNRKRVERIRNLYNSTTMD